LENRKGLGFKEYLRRVEEFHGSAAPGVLIGYFMVEAALKRIAEGTLYEAICETRVCLPDAIQLLTPCTLGNGRLKVVHVGRFAITLYDKTSGNGVRAFLDASLLDKWPEIRDWFFKNKKKAEQDSETLLGQIREAGESIISISPVGVAESFLKKVKLGAVHVCRECGEAFPVSAGEVCGGCRGELPYEFRRASSPSSVLDAKGNHLPACG
jgi:formylmethanofuran dehydrogenase subunit E